MPPKFLYQCLRFQSIFLCSLSALNYVTAHLNYRKFLQVCHVFYLKRSWKWNAKVSFGNSFARIPFAHSNLWLDVHHSNQFSVCLACVQPLPFSGQTEPPFWAMRAWHAHRQDRQHGINHTGSITPCVMTAHWPSSKFHQPSHVIKDHNDCNNDHRRQGHITIQQPKTNKRQCRYGKVITGPLPCPTPNLALRPLQTEYWGNSPLHSWTFGFPCPSVV